MFTSPFRQPKTLDDSLAGNEQTRIDRDRFAGQQAVHQQAATHSEGTDHALAGAAAHRVDRMQHAGALRNVQDVRWSMLSSLVQITSTPIFFSSSACSRRRTTLIVRKPNFWPSRMTMRPRAAARGRLQQPVAGLEVQHTSRHHESAGRVDEERRRLFVGHVVGQRHHFKGGPHGQFAPGAAQAVGHRHALSGSNAAEERSRPGPTASTTPTPSKPGVAGRFGKVP